MLEKLALPLLRRIDPERAHGLAIAALKAGFGPVEGPFTSARLPTRIAGLDMPNPIGLAAGFDKNATVAGPLQRAGFGFIELGAATPRPQPGNPRPRLFRLAEDRAAINRFGFNNDGAEAIAARLDGLPHEIPIGLNLGANKDSADRVADFAQVFHTCAPHIDFATINVSSPNTEKLRDLQGKAALRAIIEQVDAARAESTVALFLKIAPDLTEAELADIADVAIDSGRLQGIIATNTTLDRIGLQSRHAGEQGGLSGQPLFEKSTRTLARLYQLTEGKLPLIGVGGVASAEQAYTKIRAGASAVQLYTGLVYGGLGMVTKIAKGVDARLQRDGFANVAQATGTGVSEWT
ncbi:quinone-dependent dihydroorotate dehydrogenase [Gymnodinialimonas ceratoperidinii]|uniref:Dihydroorotate dehydrogenase (quinone) n=1 Tax=Gymnodinialimonas ceratoperidinii TaxID=2856823 RepID=A0A8F6YE01_9RHOB|nr:quinone-dependent dihydroorotate dehydrogenase [Gymnodinialimonas ceratoperidinii]QXT41065.1 quinone-dependent dihydroorotate dehydrogenase [Gymnodinialimonas ceratoperidinii]